MKILDKQVVDHINQELSARQWLKVIEAVGFEPNPTHAGKIEIETAKGTLSFDVSISPDFPIGKMEFVCTSHSGYNHMMHYGHMCLNTPPAISTSGRMALELEKLQLWVQKYFIEELVDEHFEYYHFPLQRSTIVIFEETTDKAPILSEFGKFDYVPLNNFTLAEKTSRCWLALTLGGRTCRWSKSFTDKFSKKYPGLWLKLEKHPVTHRRQTIQNWSDLLPLLSSRQTKFLNDTYRTLKGTSAYQDSFILMVGYDIPDGSSQEVHWETIIIHFDNFPFASVKTGPGTYEPDDLGHQVSWGKSINASYERMFGRGKLSGKLTDKKILIIGTGALGSQLFDILLRGGCKNIEISDHDTIEPGNVCRGDFSFINTHKPKLYELYNKAISVSPFVNISFTPGITAVSNTSTEYPLLKQHLQTFDYIFDCSTDKYLSIMLDGMQLKGQVFNFSISNEAKHIAVITGLGNVSITKSGLFDRLVPDGGEPFFVATGCWHPTFQASYTDILVLLSYAINEINHRLESDQSIASFFISKNIGRNNSLNYELSYNV